MSASSVTIGGRAASIARRHALSAGKSALPPAAERTRGGAAVPSAATASAASAPAASAPVTRTAAPAAAMSAVTASVNGDSRALPDTGKAGRFVSMQRRRALSAGKAALRNGAAPAPATVAAPSSATPVAQLPTAEPVTAESGKDCSCRATARARRAAHSRFGRGDAPASLPTRPPRSGTLVYAPKVVAAETHGGQQVTGLRSAEGRTVTGAARGLTLPVSGTQYIGADAGAAWRAGGPKVGLARTPGGTLVSGTLVRSSVHVTGDEAGDGIAITGEADGGAADDQTPRSGGGADVARQFARQTEPHGPVAHANLQRTARIVGSRRRAREHAIESTAGGLPVTGSAIGRSLRVTGDESGACRSVTGDQYLSPAQRQAACGGPAALAGERPDPVTGAKVALSQTWSGKRVTGIDVEHHPLVTGNAPGTCATVTGSPYQGPNTTYRWCEDNAVGEAEARLAVRPAAVAVTGDTALTDAHVTGAARGAARDITGTAYYRAAPPLEPLPTEPVARIDERFSVQSPQRSAQLRAERRGAPADTADGKITGSFALGAGKITGNLEFAFRPRSSGDGNGVPAHLRITGEGRSTGREISGAAWTPQANVTGTDSAFAGTRNPSERGSKPHAFAGARRFKALASEEEPKHLVTGMFGYSSDSAAKVTLSGGAQG